MKSRRAYKQVVRAQSAAETRRRIIDAAETIFSRERYENMTLELVAAEAGVTRQTILRLFGSKDGLLSEAAREKIPAIAQSRDAAGDLEEALDRLLASYERIGRVNWHMLLQEDQLPAMKELLDAARALHRDWVERNLAPHLPPRRRHRRDLLFAGTDFYIYKLYRRDLGMSRGETRQRMGELVHAILEAP
jgi:AcrR family transcriptional regulator